MKSLEWRQGAQLCVAVLGMVVGSIGWANADVRPEMTAIRVPDGFIKVDGRDDDWRRLGTSFEQNRVHAEGEAHYDFVRPFLGLEKGPGDISLDACAAVDAKNLYILADVHDDLLFNQAEYLEPWVGDDFEVFLDANDPAKRFNATLNENNIQFLFVPAHINLAFTPGFALRAETYPGLQFATRLRPFGYTIEIAIPKALLPNWKAHPDLDGVGFDLQLADVDTTVVADHDPSGKAELFLLQPDAHFKTAEKLGLLHLPSVAVTPGEAAPPAPMLTDRQLIEALRNPALPDGELAQQVLDSIDGKRAARIAAAAVAQAGPLTRKAGCLLLAKRPELPVDPKLLQAILADPNWDKAPLPETVSYAMVALALRHQMQPAAIYANFANAADIPTRLTFLWCLGENGDRSIVPALIETYKNTNGNVQRTAALSLAQLGDSTGVPTLQATIAGQPKDIFSVKAARLIRLLAAGEK